MIVRLTHRQLQVVANAATETSDTPARAQAFCDWVSRDLTSASGHRYDLAMPAIAWKLIADELFDQCYDARGFRTKKLKVSQLNALKAVRAAVNARESHPALSGIGAIGVIPEIIPAWKLIASGDDGKLYSPYPSTARQFVVLMPTTLPLGSGRKATKWTEVAATRLPERPLLDESEHVRFL